MATFTQWRSWAAKGDLRKVTYVCGEESFLVERVVEDIRSIVNPPATDYLVFNAGDVDDSAIWVEARHTPLDPQANRLVVVRRAEAFQDWDMLAQWFAMSKNMTSNYLVFVSGESDFPTVQQEQNNVPADYIDLIQSKGRLIRCSLPNEEDLANWLVDDYDLNYAAADFLVKHASGNLSSMINVCRKAKVFNASPSPAIIAQLCAEESHDSFVDSLIFMDKKSALRAIENISDEEYSRQIGMLDSRLELLQDLSFMLSKHMGMREMCEQGMKPFLVRKFLPVAKRYGDAKILYCRKLLAIMDDVIQSGCRKGVLETLVAMW